MNGISRRRKIEIVVLSCLWVFVCLTNFTNSGISTPNAVMAFYLALAWIVVWIVRIVAQRRGKKENPEIPRKHLWLAEPAIIAVGFLFSYYPGPYLRFFLSESSMENYVENVRSGDVDLNFEWHHPVTTIGLYSTSITDLLEDKTVRFITSSDGIFDRAGFAHSIKGPPMARSQNSYRHISGNWWYWRQSR